MYTSIEIMYSKQLKLSNSSLCESIFIFGISVGIINFYLVFRYATMIPVNVWTPWAKRRMKKWECSTATVWVVTRFGRTQATKSWGVMIFAWMSAAEGDRSWWSNVIISKEIKCGSMILILIIWNTQWRSNVFNHQRVPVRSCPRYLPVPAHPGRNGH